MLLFFLLICYFVTLLLLIFSSNAFIICMQAHQRQIVHRVVLGSPINSSECTFLKDFAHRTCVQIVVVFGMNKFKWFVDIGVLGHAYCVSSLLIRSPLYYTLF